MKKLFALLICSFLSFGLHAQSIIGAWEAFSTAENGDKLRSVLIVADGFQAMSIYDAQTGKFIGTNGGTWKLEGNTMTEIVEFNSIDPETVGMESVFDVKISDNEIEVVGSDMKMKRIDNGAPGNLQGAWLMSGRVRNGETQARDTSRPRKTMKILSGTRFQWIAYNTETKQFSGTGGGTYTTVDGKYTENIEFFSKDNAKAGLSLSFNYELVNGDWTHTGFSSKGDPIHEIWSVRKQ